MGDAILGVSGCRGRTRTTPSGRFEPAGRTDDARAYRELAATSPSPALQAIVGVVDGLLAADSGEARRILSEAVATLDGLDLRLDAARARIDLGRMLAAAGEDSIPTLTTARRMLAECDAGLFLHEVDAALAGAPAGGDSPADASRGVP